jgi:hypothetical protein
MTGENFMRLNRNSDINRIKDKIIDLKHECGRLAHINTINEVGFDEEKYDKLCKQIKWQEYLLWGLTEK